MLGVPFMQRPGEWHRWGRVKSGAQYAKIAPCPSPVAISITNLAARHGFTLRTSPIWNRNPSIWDYKEAADW